MAERAVERHPGDVIRVVAGLLLLTVLAVLATSDEVTRVEADLVDRGGPGELVAGIVERATTEVEGFPSPTTAVAAALATAAAPYLARTVRRLTWVGVFLAG